MKSNFSKLFLYEAKRILFLPLIFLLIVIFIDIFDIITVNINLQKILSSANTDLLPIYNQIKNCDDRSTTFLYLFFTILTLSVAYNTFAMHKLYEKINASSQKLFFVRLIITTCACFLYVLIELILGSVKLAALRSAIPNDTYGYAYTFSFQEKPWWYFLFCVQVAVNGGIAYATVRVAENLIFSKLSIFHKILFAIVWICTLFTCATVHTYYMRKEYILFGEKLLFLQNLPINNQTYEVYKIYWSEPEKYFKITVCALAYPINNILSVICAILTVALSYLSNLFITATLNENYLQKND